MKKNKIFILSLALLALVGCSNKSNNTSSVANTSLDSTTSQEISTSEADKQVLIDALEKAKKSIRLLGSYSTFYVDDEETTEVGSFDMTIGNDFFYEERTLKDDYSRTVNETLNLFKGKDDFIYQTKLNMLNQGEDSLYVNPFKKSETKEMNFDAYLKNPFLTLKASDFTKNADDRYELNEEKAKVFTNLIVFETTTKYYKYTCEVNSLSFFIDDKGLTDVVLKTKPESDQSFSFPHDFNYVFSFDIEFLNDATRPEVKYAERKKEHDILDAALSNLQTIVDNKNYTLHVHDIDSTEAYESEYDIYTTDKGFYSTFKPMLYDYYVGYQKDETDGNYYKYYKYLSQDNVTYAEVTETNNAKVKREDIDLCFSSFASEFFTYSEGTNSFICTNEFVVDDIYFEINSISERHDTYHATSIEFFLDTENKITKYSIVANDEYAEYVDTFTYTFKDIGTTVLPITVNERA